MKSEWSVVSPVTMESDSASNVKKSWLSQSQRRQQMPDPKADGRGRAVGWHHHQLPVKAFQADGRASNAEADPMSLAKGSHSYILLMLGPHRVHIRKYKNN